MSNKLGGWEIKISKNYPQKVASSLDKLDEFFGAKYDPMLYLGSQTISPSAGINHAVLCEQTIITGEDVKNAVIVIFNEKTNSMDVAIAEIRKIVESGGKLGGTDVEVTTEIPAEAQEALNSAKGNFLGSDIEPVAYLGKKMANGYVYKLLAKVSPVVPNPEVTLTIVTVHSMEKKIEFEAVL